MVRISSVLLFFLGVTNLFGQELIHYTTNDGLPSNHVYDIAQDTAGFMWFATNRGVAKFDGVEFKTFTVKDGLPNNDTWQLEADFQGKVWYFSKSKYQGYIQNDSIYKFLAPDSLVISPSNISKSNDSLWLYDDMVKNFIYIEDHGFKKAARLTTQEGRRLFKRLGIPGQGWNLLFNPDLKLYAALTQNKIWIADFDNNFHDPIEHDFPVDHNTFKIISSGSMPDGTFYLIRNEGVLFINFKNRFSRYFTYENLVGQKMPSNIFCKALSEEFQLSVSGYLFRFNYHLELIEKIVPPIINCHRSFRDTDGNIWFLTMGNGILLLPNTQAQTNYYLIGKPVQKIGKIDQTIYAGVSNEGFYEYIVERDDLKKKTSKKTELIYQINYDNVGKQGYLIGSNFTLQYHKGVFSELTHPNPQSTNNLLRQFKDIVNFKDAQYLLTTTAFYKHDFTNKIITRTIRRQGLITSVVHNRSLYIGASDGFYKLENNNLVRPRNSKDLLNVSILCFLSTKDFLIIGTDGRGVFLFENEKKQIIHLENTDDLSIQKIIRNELDIWLATQKGVLKITLDTANIAKSLIVDAFFEEDGLLENNTNDIHIEGNELYAASYMGLAKIDLNNPIYRKKPKLLFKTLNDTLRLDGATNSVNIDFMVLNYVNQRNFDYTYRLQPVQEEWLHTNGKTINFSNLEPNFYTLEVTATDQHGNKSIANQYLEIVPAWWQTISARVGFAIFTGLLFIGLLKLFQMRINKRAEQDKRMAGLELQALRSQMNPHFVHNSLNAILYYIQRSEINLSERYLVKFSKLIRLFFEYSRKKNITISNEVKLLSNYLEIEKLRFEDKLQYQIQVDERIDQEEQFIPSMILQPIVENAVNHGLFHKRGMGKVNISFQYINDFSFKVTIEDDGIGIKKAQAIFNKSSRSYQSRSSEVLKERLTLLKQSNYWDILYQVEDLSAKGAISGTLVSLTFNQLID